MDDETQEYGELYGDDGSEETNPNDTDYAADSLYDDNQEAAQDAEGSDAAEAQDTAPVADSEEEYTPPNINVPLLSVEDAGLFTESEAEQLNEMALNGQFAQAMAIIASRQQAQNLRVMQRMMQANVLHSNTLAAAENECGEWFRQHGGTIRQTMATLPPEQAGTETAKFAALIAPALYEVQAGADAVKTFTRMARMAARQAGQQANSPVPTPQPPAPRVAPSGSRTGTGSAPGVGKPKSEVEELMQLTGMNRMESESALRGMQETNAVKRGRGGYR